MEKQYSFEHMTDAEVKQLFCEVSEELENRKSQLAARRERWVRRNYTRFIRHPHAVTLTVGETTVVSVYDEFMGNCIASARPVKGDVYDQKTGIAVAYVKAMREKVPSYI
jgi:hypothetical protein